MENLSKSELYKIIVEKTNEGVWVVDNEYHTDFVNPKMANMLQSNEEEMRDKSFFNFLNNKDMENVKKNLLTHNNSTLNELKLVTKKKKPVWVRMNASPIIENEKFIGSIVMVSDISEKKRREKLIEVNLENYYSLFEECPIPVWDVDFSAIKKQIDKLKTNGILDLKKHFEFNQDELIRISKLFIVNEINKAVVKLYEADSKEQVYNNVEGLITHDFIKYIIPELNKISKGKLESEEDIVMRTLKGNKRYLHLKWAVVKGYEKNYKKVFITTTDLTNRIKEENILLQKMNREKETLLKEIHHRVKNNLQIISSLLKLQAKSINDPKINDYINVSLNRINSMATVHEILYKSTNFSKIDYQKYLQKLIDSLVMTMCGENNQIKVEIDVDEIHFNLNTAIPLGLLINEILTNSLKHAFNDGDNGVIYVKIRRENNNVFEMEIGDNGKGLENFTDDTKEETLGLSLIYSLAQQVLGTIVLDKTRKGTNYRVEFMES